MSDKSTILRGFNNLFFEFLNDISSIFPDNTDIKDTQTSLEFFKKANPTCIIKAWNYFVAVPYKDIIENGDISFFCDKDYNNDLVYMSNADEIMKAIDRIRDPIKNMNDSNKSTSMTYIQNLSKLSNVYDMLTK